MRKIILSTVTMALIAASASQAFAAQPQRHHARKAVQPTSAQFGDARNAIERPSQPAWPYSGWSAPAGR